MKKPAVVSGLAAMIFVTGTLSIFSALIQDGTGNSRDAKAGGSKPAYASDRLLVKFIDDAKGLPAPAAQANAESVYELTKIRHFSSIDVSVYRVRGDVMKVIKALRKDPNVAYAEPDYLRRGTDVYPNDSLFGRLWGLHNSGQNGGTPGADIDAPHAWGLTTGSPDVVVAVIDTGVDYRHVDLSANMWSNPGEIAGNGVDDDANGFIDDVHGINTVWYNGDPRDDNGHGTHCAGTIAAVGNNGTGVTGVCWTAKIMALKFLDADGWGYDSDAIMCIEYATAKGAQILSNSWGGGGLSVALAEAIGAAGRAGILFVAAAGNDGKNLDLNPDYPASYSNPNILTVAATGPDDLLADWSNFGHFSVDVAAPGVSILSTIPSNSYGTMSGTSMATPYVAGLAALLKSADPSRDWRQLKCQIMAGIDPLEPLRSKILSGGRINAFNSLVAPPVESYRLEILSPEGLAVPIAVSTADLDGQGAGTTDFVRRYAPYAEVTLTAPDTENGRRFSSWSVDGVRISSSPTISLMLDYDRAIEVNYAVPLNEALDNPSLRFITGGYGGGWEGQTLVSYSGGSAARSRPMGDVQSSYLQASVVGPGTLSFFWKVSSGWDFLEFCVDNVQDAIIGGEVDWQIQSYAIPAGVHVISWRYIKTNLGTGGEDYGCVDLVCYDGPPASLGMAVDDDTCVWTSGGDGGWHAQSADFNVDGDAVKTAWLLDGQQSFIQTVVEGPTTGSYYWKVSSEAEADWLTFSIDGATEASISGEVDWRQESFALGAGTHTLMWTYAKDSALRDGLDSAWLDGFAYGLSGDRVLTVQSRTIGGEVGGATNPAPGTYSYAAGEQVSLFAVPAEGYRFAGWTGDVPAGHANDNPLTIGLTVDRTITATFAFQVTLAITVVSEYGTDGGQILAEPPGTALATGTWVYDYAAVVNLSPRPTWFFRFKGWTGDVPAGHEEDQPLRLSMTGNSSVTATFVRIYTLEIWPETIDGIDGGTTDPAPIFQYFDAGTKPPIKALPAEGFRFSSWTGNVEAGHETDNPLLISMDSDKMVTARFLRIIYAPPEITGRHERNRSYFQEEYVNVLNWTPDPRNETVGLTITNYRVYLVNGQGRTILANLNADARSYWHRHVAKDGVYTYAICAVNTTGREGDLGYIYFNGSSVSRDDGKRGIEIRRDAPQATQGPVKVRKR